MSPQEYKEKHQDEMDKVVTVGVLLELTDSFLIPRFSEVMDEKIADSERRLKLEIIASEHRVKDYIDRKLFDHTAELFKRLDERYQKDRQFKQKVIELFRKHSIGSTDEVAFLEGLAQ